MRKLIFLLWIAATIVSYPVLMLGARFAKKRTGNGKRVLVIPQLTRIGDIVCSTPVFYNIKKTYPESHITVLVSKKAFGILKNNKRIDDFIILEDYSALGLVRRIQKEHFNWSFSLSATSVSTCWTVWGMIPNRVKTVVETPPITERLTDWMANHVLLYKNHTYLPHHHTRLLTFMGISNPEDKKEVFVSENSEEKATAFISSIPAKKIVGLSISAGNKIKEWGDHNFAEVARQLLKKADTAVVVIGGKTDLPRINEFIKQVNHPLCIPGTDFNLEELSSLMKRFSLYIAVDTGPIYIAHALDTPLIDIVGPCDPTEQPPSDSKSIQILPKGVEPSSFVFKRRGPAHKIEEALRAIDINEVLAAAHKLLA